MLRKAALAVLTNLSQLMAEKLEEPILHVCDWISGWIVITAVR